jgi:hypothetical protein
MSLSPELREKLLSLADQLCDGTLSEAEQERLNQLLRESEELRQCFLAHRELHASLSWNGRGSRVPASLFGEAVPATAEKAESSTYVLGQRTAAIGKALPRRGLFAAAAAALLLLLGWWMWPAAPVAELTRTFEAAWDANSTSLDSLRGVSASEKHAVALAAGQQLQLISGLAEVRFRSGARIVLEGPAAFEIGADNSGRLRVGKLVAQVPHQAAGFEIQTPAARVIDRGTEFAIVVEQPAGNDPNALATEVHVLAGHVEVAPLGVAPASALPVDVVSAGKAVRAATDQQSLASIKIQPERFVRELPGEIVTAADFEDLPLGALAVRPQWRTMYESSRPGHDQSIRVVAPQDLPSARFGRQVLEIRDEDGDRKQPGPVFDLLLPKSLATEPVQLRFDFRILSPASRPLMTVYNREWYLMLGPQVSLNAARLGSLEPGQWYRATLDLPAVSPNPATARVRIEKLADGRPIDGQTLAATHVRRLPGDAVRFGFHSPQVQPAGGRWQIDNVEVRAPDKEESLR